MFTDSSVTPHALVQRINRVLAKDDRKLKVTRGKYWRSNFGQFHIINQRNCTISVKIDLESFGRELGCLRHYECICAE